MGILDESSFERGKVTAAFFDTVAMLPLDLIGVGEVATAAMAVGRAGAAAAARAAAKQGMTRTASAIVHSTQFATKTAPRLAGEAAAAVRKGMHEAAQPFVRFGVHDVIGNVASRKTYQSAINWAERRGWKACFSAGTPIQTANGPKKIEDFVDFETAGDACDRVISRNEHLDDAPLVLRRVLQAFSRDAAVLELTVAGKVIGTTAEHPFFVKSKGWTPAHELRVGDELRLMEPGWVKVEGIADTGRVEKVYNLEIEDDHTYFVGCDEWGFSVWAHNQGCGPNAERWTEALADRYGRQNVDIVAPKRFVADSNVFMDKSIIQGGVNVRPLFDDVLTDVAASRFREVLIPSIVKAEIKPTPSQLSRLNSIAHQAQVVRTDIDAIIASHPGILSTQFGRADLQMLETARILEVPVVTSNSAIRNQIANHAARNALFGHLQILVPGQNLPNSAHLMTVLSALH